MNTITQSLTHRAHPATRTRVRWQPYNNMQSSSSSLCSSRSPTSVSASIVPPPPTTMTSSPPPKANIDRHRPTELLSNPSQDSITRETPRNRLAAHLVEQAIKSLSEIWRPQDIPSVFRTSAPSFATTKVGPQLSRSSTTNSFNSTHLPSPITPSISPVTPIRAVTNSSQPTSKANSESLTPIKPFVHEVLRRSRTSGFVLQTALCYLEAIRPKITDIQHQFALNPVLTPQPPSLGTLRISHEIILDPSPTASCPHPENGSRTVRVCDEDDIGPSTLSTLISPEPFASNLPSPLLCPRRAFLAALILASKFTQDKCYSNRAWAKLCGLPPREISRCEHALGEALEWRLWVGKVPAMATSPSPPPGRPITRSQSESCLPPPPLPMDPSLRRAHTLAAIEFMSSSQPSNIPCPTSLEPFPASPTTPPLTHSPSPTESSSSEKSVQMSAFLEDSLPSSQEPWLWPEICQAAMGVVSQDYHKAAYGGNPIIWSNSMAGMDTPSYLHTHLVHG